jgi:predicted O-methyltransferase YrrM
MTKHIGRVPQIFELKEAFEFGKKKGLEIHEKIEGRYAGEPYDWGLMSQMIVWANGGNHLEIGTLFGGSAILAALTKREFSLSGQVTCVDPLTGYYGNPIDVQSKTNVTADAVRRNADIFGANERIELITKLSQPWPLGERRFASAFIDGAHDYASVMSDWENCSKFVDGVIQFDNFDLRHYEIAQVVMTAINHPGWALLHASGITAILSRPQHIWTNWKPV